jgi:hypothetical protein
MSLMPTWVGAEETISGPVAIKTQGCGLGGTGVSCPMPTDVAEG